MNFSTASKLLAPVLTLLCALPIWLTRYPAIVDFPVHIVKVQIARHPSLFEGYYTYSWHPRPHMFFDLVSVCLSSVFSVLTAGKIVLTLYLLTAFLVTKYLLERDRSPLLPLLLWPALIVCNWWYGVGSANLLFGHLFSLFCIAYCWHHAKDPWRRTVPAAAFLLALILLCHPMSFLITVSLLILAALWNLPVANRLKYALVAVYAAAVAGAAAAAHAVFNQPWTPLQTAGELLWLLHDYKPEIETKVFKIALASLFAVWLLHRKDPFRSFILPGFLLLLIFLTPAKVDMSGHNELRIAQYFLFALPFMVPSPRKIAWRAAISAVLAICAGVWITVQCAKQLYYDGCYREVELVARMLPPKPEVNALVNFSSAPTDLAGYYLTYYNGGGFAWLYETPFWGVRFHPGYAAKRALREIDGLSAYTHLLYYKKDGMRPRVTSAEVEAAGFKRIFTGRWVDCFEKDSLFRIRQTSSNNGFSK